MLETVGAWPFGTFELRALNLFRVSCLGIRCASRDRCPFVLSTGGVANRQHGWPLLLLTQSRLVTRFRHAREVNRGELATWARTRRACKADDIRYCWRRTCGDSREPAR